MWIEFDGLRVKEALSVTDLCKDAPKMLFSGSVRKNSCVSSYIDTKRKL